LVRLSYNQKLRILPLEANKLTENFTALCSERSKKNRKIAHLKIFVAKLLLVSAS